MGSTGKPEGRRTLLQCDSRSGSEVCKAEAWFGRRLQTVRSLRRHEQRALQSGSQQQTPNPSTVSIGLGQPVMLYLTYFHEIGENELVNRGNVGEDVRDEASVEPDSFPVVVLILSPRARQLQVWKRPKEDVSLSWKCLPVPVDFWLVFEYGCGDVGRRRTVVWKLDDCVASQRQLSKLWEL
jgi:hypothetical protein